MDAAGLRAAIDALCSDDIACRVPDEPDTERWLSAEESREPLSARTPPRLPCDNWRVTSYSGLQQRGHGIAQDLIPGWTLMRRASVKRLWNPDSRRTSSRVGRHRAHFCIACLKRLILPSRWTRFGCRNNSRLAGMTHIGRRF